MANTTIMSNNQAKSGVYAVTTGTASTQFPVTNIPLDFTTKTTRVTSSSGVVRITITLPVDTEIDTVAVVGSNITGLGFSELNIRTSLTSDFSSATAIPVALSAEYNWGYAFYTSRVARVVQLEFLNAPEFIEISNIYIGQRTTLSSSYSRDGFSRETLRNDTIQTNQYGNRFVDVRNSQDIITGTFPIMERANFLILEDIFLRHGGYDPVWIMLDQTNQIFTDGEFKMSFYSYINNAFSHDLIGGGYFNVQLDLIEVV